MTRRKTRSVAVALAVWLALFASVVAALADYTFPVLTGRVVDAADLLPADVEAAITDKLAALETKSSDQLVVVTLPSLQGGDIADFGYRLGRAWGIGQQGLDNGALLIVAPNERKVRIEVGRGLEPTLTDAITSVIIQGAILPAFRSGDMPKGISDGVNAIVEVLTMDESEWKRRAERGLQSPSGETQDGLILLLVAALVAFILITFIINVRRQGLVNTLQPGRRRGWGNGPVIITSGSNWGGGGFSSGGGSFGGGGSSGSW